MIKHTSSSGKHTVCFPVIVLAVWLLFSVAASADIRIVMGDDISKQEYLFQGPRAAMFMPEGEQFVVFCELGTFALVAAEHSVYWYGTPQQFRDELDDMLELFASLDEDFFEDEPVFLADLYEGRGVPDINVRTSLVGTETIAGYEAREYLVEYERNGVWETYENLWVAPDLLREVNAETGGPCMNTVVMDLLRSYMAMMIFDMMDEFGVMWAITTSPAYLALLDEGFVARDHSTVEMFGITVKTETEVLSVTRDPLDAAWFVIPTDAEPVTLLELAM